MPIAIAPIYIIYAYDLYITKKWKTETNKLSFLKIKRTLKIKLIFKLKLSVHDCVLQASFQTEKNQANFLREKWKPQDTKERFCVKVNLLRWKHERWTEKRICS